MVIPYESIVTYYGKAIKVLIVDDHPLNRHIIEDTFSRINIYSEEACSASHALQLLEKTLFDLVITDLRMPGMDGYELASIIKSKENPPLVYLCSADFFQIQKRNEQNVNIDNVIIKPIKSDDITTQIGKDFNLKWIYLGKAQDRDKIPKYKESTGFPTDYHYIALDELNENYQSVSGLL